MSRYRESRIFSNVTLLILFRFVLRLAAEISLHLRLTDAEHAQPQKSQTHAHAPKRCALAWVQTETEMVGDCNRDCQTATGNMKRPAISTISLQLPLLVKFYSSSSLISFPDLRDSADRVHAHSESDNHSYQQDDSLEYVGPYDSFQSTLQHHNWVLFMAHCHQLLLQYSTPRFIMNL